MSVGKPEGATVHRLVSTDNPLLVVVPLSSNRQREVDKFTNFFLRDLHNSWLLRQYSISEVSLQDIEWRTVSIVDGKLCTLQRARRKLIDQSRLKQVNTEITIWFINIFSLVISVKRTQGKVFAFTSELKVPGFAKYNHCLLDLVDLKNLLTVSYAEIFKTAKKL